MVVFLSLGEEDGGLRIIPPVLFLSLGEEDEGVAHHLHQR